MAAEEGMERRARSLSLLPANVLENVLRLALEDDTENGTCTAARLAQSCEHLYRTWRKMFVRPGPYATAIATWLASYTPSSIRSLLSCGSLEVDEVLQLMAESDVSKEQVAG